MNLRREELDARTLVRSSNLSLLLTGGLRPSAPSDIGRARDIGCIYKHGRIWRWRLKDLHETEHCPLMCTRVSHPPRAVKNEKYRRCVGKATSSDKNGSVYLVPLRRAT